MNVKEAQKAYDILKTYNGNNNQILYYKKLYENKQLILKEFDIEYINGNFDYETKEYNKVVGISSDFGKRLQEKYELDFTPEKILITKIIGEMGNSYHCYVQYRKSVNPKLMYVSKRCILNQLSDIDYNSLDVDFSVYDKKTEHLNRKLKEHQKSAVKFLLSYKKCILADQMGLGKTTSAIIASLAGNYKKILIITTASLKSTWKREVKLYVDEEDIQIIKGSEWDGSKKFTITNYDIVQNFYEVPMEPVFEEQTIVGNNGKVEVLKVPVMVKSKSNGKLVQKMQKSRKKDKIKECLANSPLFLNQFDCVIIDEAQKLSNNTSIRYRVIEDFLKRSNPDAIFLVTGTPLTNRPYNLYNILKLIDADITKDYQYYVQRYCDGKTFKLKDGKEITTRNGASHLNELREKIKHLYIRRLQSDIPGMVQKSVITREYDLTDEQKEIYDKLWDEYVTAQNDREPEETEQYKQLVEGSIVRQYLAKEMAKHTIDEVDDYIEYGEKAIIFCTYREEMEIFRKHFGKKCVVYDGTMSVKQKDNAEYEFMNNPKVKVFIGQIIAASVGLTLTISNRLWFNSYSWVAADNLQAQDRIYRLTQTRDVTCQYQLFTDSISKNMFDKVMYKELIMNETIKSENDK